MWEVGCAPGGRYLLFSFSYYLGRRLRSSPEPQGLRHLSSHPLQASPFPAPLLPVHLAAIPATWLRLPSEGPCTLACPHPDVCRTLPSSFGLCSNASLSEQDFMRPLHPLHCTPSTSSWFMSSFEFQFSPLLHVLGIVTLKTICLLIYLRERWRRKKERDKARFSLCWFTRARPGSSWS